MLLPTDSFRAYIVSHLSLSLPLSLSLYSLYVPSPSPQYIHPIESATTETKSEIMIQLFNIIRKQIIPRSQQINIHIRREMMEILSKYIILKSIIPRRKICLVLEKISPRAKHAKF